MEMDELLRNIEKARAHALAEAKKHDALAQAAPDATTKLALAINVNGELSVVRALDTMLGRDTPSPLLEQD